MTIQMKLTVSAIPIWGIGGGVWPFFSHTDCTFCFHESVILVSNETNIACMIWLVCGRNLPRGSRIGHLLICFLMASAESRGYFSYFMQAANEDFWRRGPPKSTTYSMDLLEACGHVVVICSWQPAHQRCRMCLSITVRKAECIVI